MSKPKKAENLTSDVTEVVPNVTETPTVSPEALSLNTKIDLEQKITTLEAQITKMKNQEKQLMLATKLNTIKELEIQNKEHIKYANQNIIKKLVDTLLNFQRALKFKTDNPEVQNFLVGFQYIYDELIKSLSKEGLKEISVEVGEQFNSNKHDAIEIIKTDLDNTFKNVKNNTVIEVIANGYELHNRTISPIKVKVFQTENKEETKKN